MRPPTKLLTAARHMLDKSQAQLAEDIGVNSRTVYKVETGNGGLESVEAIVSYFARNGITFAEPTDSRGWAIFNQNVSGSFDDERRRHRENRQRTKLKKSSVSGQP